MPDFSGFHWKDAVKWLLNVQYMCSMHICCKYCHNIIMCIVLHCICSKYWGLWGSRSNTLSWAIVQTSKLVFMNNIALGPTAAVQLQQQHVSCLPSLKLCPSSALPIVNWGYIHLTLTIIVEHGIEFIFGILPARCYASAGMCDGISVCLSVCHTRALYQNG